MGTNSVICAIKRGNSAPARAARFLLRALIYPHGLRVPEFLKPLFRVLYEMHYGVIIICRALVTIFYRQPLFQARCASVGKNLSIDRLPFVSGHTEIHIGDNVKLGGNICVYSGRWLERPTLTIKDRAQIGWNVELSVNREIIIEEDARIAAYCRVSDSDGHPREADLRAQDAALDLNDIRPVRIGRCAWIGHSSHIMKGVTIGEGAVVAANSVVISNVPAYSLAMGNPAEIYFRGFGRPATPKVARQA